MNFTMRSKPLAANPKPTISPSVIAPWIKSEITGVPKRELQQQRSQA